MNPGSESELNVYYLSFFGGYLTVWCYYDLEHEVIKDIWIRIRYHLPQKPVHLLFNHILTIFSTVWFQGDLVNQVSESVVSENNISHVFKLSGTILASPSLGLFYIKI